MTAHTGPGLYLHLPFCSAICPYCDFYVLTGDPARRRRFVDSLIAEIALCAGGRWPVVGDESPVEPFDTLYLGGGTPSILAGEELTRTLEALRLALPIADDVWISLEANPEDVTPANLAAWRQMDVRFLSLGVQSFQQDNLDFLGRRHTSEQSRRSLDLALGAGFQTVSVDLIYGLPHQTREGWRRELEQAVDFGPQHLSCYQLTIHERTPFGFRLERGELEELPESDQAELFLFTHRYLAEHGLDGYEVSNFAAGPEHRSRHNRKYWDHTPYLGLGPSAHSFVGNRRWWNVRKIKPWEARLEAGSSPVETSEELSPTDLALERLMLALRTSDGLDLDAFQEAYGVDALATNSDVVDRHVRADLLTFENGHLTPTFAGLAVADTLARSFEIPG
ncbi:MAG: radical SAM family heme chaperone HemW [Thermoanaerobaculia bacterium]